MYFYMVQVLQMCRNIKFVHIKTKLCLLRTVVAQNCLLFWGEHGIRGLLIWA